MSTKARSTRNNRIFRLGELPREVAGRVVKLPRELADQAQARGRSAWLAGLGALATVEEQGVSMYESLLGQSQKLVERGEGMEQRGQQRLESLKAEVNQRRAAVVEQVETRVYDPMVDALRKLGVPTGAEVQRLSAQVESLAERVSVLLGKLERAQVSVYSVVAREDGWAVEKRGAERALSVHATKDEALESARGLAGRNKPSELVVHRKDGTVQDTLVYDA